MNPQQPYGAFPPPPGGGNPYDFIMAPPTKPVRSRGLGSGSLGMKLAVVAGGAVVIIIVLTLLVNLVLGGRGDFSNIISIAKTQQEIARVAGEGKQGISDQSVAGAAINTRLTMLTQQSRLQTYLATNRQKKLSAKQLGEKRDSLTDKQFQQAKATSTFDPVFTQTLRQQLTDYATELKRAYNHAPGNEGKKLLAADYQQTILLLQQLPKK